MKKSAAVVIFAIFLFTLCFCFVGCHDAWELSTDKVTLTSKSNPDKIVRYYSQPTRSYVLTYPYKIKYGPLEKRYIYFDDEMIEDTRRERLDSITLYVSEFEAIKTCKILKIVSIYWDGKTTYKYDMEDIRGVFSEVWSNII